MRLELQVALTLPRGGRTVRFGADPSQVAELHRPRGGDSPLPVAVLLHGGYWRTQYGKLVMRPLARDLVRRGYGVLNLEYRRLGPARGGGGGWPMTFEDVAAGLDLVADLDAALDLSDVTLVGHSAGGQLALWAAARSALPLGAVGAGPQVCPSAVVALAPVTDLRSAGASALALLGAPPAEQPERWAQADPVRSGPPPVPALVVHPTADTTVPVQRSREYSARTGVPLVETAGGHRDPIDPSSPAWAAAVEWLAARRASRT